MSRLHAGLFRVINRNLGRLICALGNVLARIFRSAIGQVKSLFAAIRGLNGNGLRSPVYVGNRAVGGLQPIVTDLVDLVRGFLAAHDCVVHGDFAALLHSMGCIYGSLFRIFGSIDGDIAGVVKGVFGAVFGVDNYRLCPGVNFLNRSVHCMNDILGRKAQRGE